jgi:hypothetical protein
MAAQSVNVVLDPTVQIFSISTNEIRKMYMYRDLVGNLTIMLAVFQDSYIVKVVLNVDLHVYIA